MSEFYGALSLICLILAAILLVLLVFLWFRWRIPENLRETRRHSGGGAKKSSVSERSARAREKRHNASVALKAEPGEKAYATVPLGINETVPLERTAEDTVPLKAETLPLESGEPPLPLKNEALAQTLPLEEGEAPQDDPGAAFQILEEQEIVHTENTME